MTTRDRKLLRSHEVYKFNDISFNISILGTKRAIHMNKNSILLISKELFTTSKYVSHSFAIYFANSAHYTLVVAEIIHVAYQLRSDFCVMEPKFRGI